MDTRHTLLDGADAEAATAGTRTFFYLLSAYFLPRGLLLDPEAHGSWDRWSRRRHNLAMLRVYSLVFARRWVALWLLGYGLGALIGGALGGIVTLAGGFALMPAIVFVSLKIAANIAGDDLPL